MAKFIDLTGKKINHLTIIKFAFRKRRTYWLCKCDCGKTKIIEECGMKRNRIKSCGCIQKGKRSYNWTSKPTYRTIHSWLQKNFGKINQCEHCGITAEEYRKINSIKIKNHPIEYAKIKGKKHSRKRENYICLCLKCHHKYDGH